MSKSYLKEIERLTDQIGDEYYLSHYLDLMSDGYFDWKIQQDYEYMSPRFWEIFGYKPEEKEHKPSAWMEMIDKDDLKKAGELLNKHFESHGEIPYIIEVRYTHKKGHIVTVLCRGKVIEWKGEEPLRMIGTHTDITELRK